jgi:hypothetical protein
MGLDTGGEKVRQPRLGQQAGEPGSVPTRRGEPEAERERLLGVERDVEIGF